MFTTFDLEMAFAPQRFALLRHRIAVESSKSAPNPTQFFTLLTSHFSTLRCFCILTCWRLFPFWLGHVLRAITACNFSLLIWPAGSAPAALASRPSGATKHWKNTVFRDFATFSRTCICSLLTFFISYLLTSDCLPVWASSWLCFSICPHCRTFHFS